MKTRPIRPWAVGATLACGLISQSASSEELLRYYPEQAARLNIEGIASLHCTVTVAGTLTDCSVLAEDPPGFGFGEAALKMTPQFKMRPASAVATPAQSDVKIPVRFKLPPEPPPPPKQKADPRVLKWGRAQIEAGLALSETCKADLKATGQQDILKPGTTATDPTFMRQRATLQAASAVLKSCEARFKEGFLPRALEDLKDSGLSLRQRAIAFSEFQKGFVEASTSELMDMQTVLDAEDAALVHLQTFHATFDHNTQQFIIPDPTALAAFQRMVTHINVLAEAIRSNSEARTEVAKSF